MGLTMRSASFRHMENIPARYTCDGADISVPLSWQGLPQGTQSLALIVGRSGTRRIPPLPR